MIDEDEVCKLTSEYNELFNYTVSEFLYHSLLMDHYGFFSNRDDILSLNKKLNIEDIGVVELENIKDTFFPIKSKEIYNYFKELYNIELDDDFLKLKLIRSMYYLNRKKLLVKELNEIELFVLQEVKEKFKLHSVEMKIIEKIMETNENINSDNMKSNNQSRNIFIFSTLISILSFVISLYFTIK